MATAALPDLIPSAVSTSDNSIRSEVQAALVYAKAEKAASTRRAYATDFRLFSEWCISKGATPLPASPETVAAYLAAQADYGAKASSITRRAAAIRYAHKLAGYEPPTAAEGVKATLRGIRRTVGSAPLKKLPVTADRARAMAARADDSKKGLRDRALLLLGFGGALRRSELVALDVADIQETVDGLRVMIRHSKTDQESEGATIAIARGDVACPVKAIRAWLEAASIKEGALFRPINKAGNILEKRLTAQSVAIIVKTAVKSIGLDAKQFAGHSLRAGFLTSAAAKGASVFKMMDVSRHKSVDTLRGYVRDAELFRDHAGEGLL